MLAPPDVSEGASSGPRGQAPLPVREVERLSLGHQTLTENYCVRGTATMPVTFWKEQALTA